MKDKEKTKEQLINELAEMRQRVAELEASKTECKRTEEALKKSEANYRAIFDAANDAIVVHDIKTGAILDVNRQFCEMTGYSREETQHLTVEALSSGGPPYTQENALQRIKKAAEGRPQLFEWRSKDRAGRLIWTEVNLKCAVIGSEDRVLAIVRDVTERKRTEETLRESEERFRTLVEHAADAFFLHDLKGKLVDVNQRACDSLGYTREELLALSVPDVEIDYDSRRVGELWNPMVPGVPVTAEGTHRRKDGTTFPVEVRLGMFELGGRQFMLALARDVTERKRAEEELRNSREQLRNLSTHLQFVREEERTRIAREIHDELGQAMTALKMDLFWLKKHLRRDQKSLLEKIELMSTLIDRTIHTVQRISSELRPGLLDDLGLTAAIEWQAEEFQNRTGIQCEVDFDPEEVVLDQERSTVIFRIFQETLTNIFRHAEATRVNISLREEAGELVFMIKDNGKGITEEQISDPRAFGLIGIQERVRFLGGEVKISGIPEKGTRVTVGVPLDKKERGDDKNTRR